MTLAKIVTKTLDVGVKDTKIDLSATIKSYDLTDTKFIFNIVSNQGLNIDLTGSTAMYIVEYVHNSQNYAIQGEVDIVDSTTIAFNLPEDLKGYKGTVLIGLYVQMTDGTKIDIKDIIVRIEPSIMDKDIDFSAKTYFKDFETVKAEVILEGEKAKNQINAVLPTVQSQVSELDRQIKALPQIPDLFVAYADNLNGSGFSKTDASKLYKGYGVKNSNVASDYRWERNGDNLQVGSTNLLNGTKDFNSKYWGNPSYVKADTDGFSYVELLNTFTQSIGCNITLKKGTYTISFYAKCATNQGIEFKNVAANVPFFTKLIDSRDWKKYVVTINVASDTTTDLSILTRQNTDIVYLKKINWVEGNVEKAWCPSENDMTLNSNPINSILTTLSQENPSTTLGGIWVQLGNETKFNNTIYYWKRTK